MRIDSPLLMVKVREAKPSPPRDAAGTRHNATMMRASAVLSA
jgi:hypothetical protein